MEFIMKYGCIGEKLKHSFSKEIHNSLADYEYELVEIKREKLKDFMISADFNAINVTIPYKEAVIPYLHEIDDNARLIGAVNTIVNRNGKLFGYNTDFYGMKKLILKADVILSNKKIAILGTGGTSKTAYAVCLSLGAKTIVKVSRSAKDNAITYDELYKNHSDIDVIINTTPLGMFPDIYDSAVDISNFPSLCGVIDVVYNPLSTPLVLSAKERGIPASGGLYMLVAQAVRASEIFIDKKYESEELDRVYRKIQKAKENIVLTGMPASGKSTVGKMLSEKLSRSFIDTDALIEKNAGCSIKEIFENKGEEYFRSLESEAIKEASKNTGSVIATGGGAILREENVKALKANGKIFFIDRPLEKLVPTGDRPLASNKAAIEKRYKERYGIYTQTADFQINADKDENTVAKLIEEKFYE